jgi:hypothetical protein
MNRRGFLTSLAALATTAVLPSVPSIPVVDPKRWVMKVACNSLYGKMGVARATYFGAGSVAQYMMDYRSAYPHSLSARMSQS